MSQLEKLQALQAQNQQTKNLQLFKQIIAVHVGVKPKEHFPKKLDENGNKIKDEKGADLRSETSDGWTHTLVEFGTGKLVKVVLSEYHDLELLKAYQVAGLGYDIRSGNMFFIEQKGQIAEY